jgi:hypothetical protein
MPRNITQHHRACANRLRSIWKANAKSLGLTQVKAAEVLGFSSQAVISQYLNCHIALNLSAVIGFARLLQVEPSAIDPTVRLGFAQASPVSGVPVRYTMSGAPVQRSLRVVK